MCFMPFTDGLIRRDASDLAMDTLEVIKHKPVMQIVFHLLNVFIDVEFSRAFLD